MKRCQMMVDVGRRQFLSGASMAAAGVAAATVVMPQAKAAPAPARVNYPSNRLANVSDLKLNEPLNVSYPDNDAPGVLLKLGKRVADGSGPDGDIVGFSTTCPHKGFPLSYNKSDRTLNCPGHYSRFDCEAGGARLISSLGLQLALSTKWVRTVYSSPLSTTGVPVAATRILGALASSTSVP